MLWGIIGFIIGLVFGVVLTCLTQIGRLVFGNSKEELKDV